jgi:hypothetical protein
MEECPFKVLVSRKLPRKSRADELDEMLNVDGSTAEPFSRNRKEQENQSRS